MARQGKRRRIAKGISRDQTGFAVRLQVDGEPIEKRFTADTPLKTMTDWRDATVKRMKARVRAGLPAAGTFAADAAAYLRKVTAMPDYAQRVRDIGLWVDLFGHRRRHDIEPHEIREARDRWLTVGPKLVIKKGMPRTAPTSERYEAIAKPLAPNTVALRMRALENLWTVLDGRQAFNPVREVPEPPDRDPEPRGLPFDVVKHILDQMPATKTRARCKVMAYVGLAHVEIKGIRREGDLSIADRWVWVRRRRKGKGGKMAPPARQPLTKFGAEAFTEFVEQDAFGPFSNSSLWRDFHAASEAAGFPAVRPYDLRHSFATAHFKAGGNIIATQEALRQRNPATTKRYVAAAISPSMAEASNKLEALIKQQQRPRRRERSSTPTEPRNRAQKLGTRGLSSKNRAKRSAF